MSYVWEDGGSLCQLKRFIWLATNCGNMGDGPYMSIVVHLEGNEWLELWEQGTLLKELKCFFDRLMSCEIAIDFNGLSFHDFLVSSTYLVSSLVYILCTWAVLFYCMSKMYCTYQSVGWNQDVLSAWHMVWGWTTKGVFSKVVEYFPSKEA